jgi:hypothetical protein
MPQAAQAARAGGGAGGDEVRPRAPRAQTRSATAPVADGNVFRREGDYWSATFEGRTIRLRDLRGIRYLARLLAEPGRQFHVLDMVALPRDGARNATLGPEAGLELASSSDAGELLDERAKEAYRRRLSEIEEDIEDASAAGDTERVARADAERDFLLRELSRAIGLGGRDRRAGSASERARASVTRAIRQAMARIREHDPVLGEHLARAIRTGTYCVYLPDARLSGGWKL